MFPTIGLLLCCIPIRTAFDVMYTVCINCEHVKVTVVQIQSQASAEILQHAMATWNTYGRLYSNSSPTNIMPQVGVYCSG